MNGKCVRTLSYLVILACCLIVGKVRAQQYSGVVTDAANDNPLGSVSVSLKGTAHETTTNSLGEFVLDVGATLIGADPHLFSKAESFSFSLYSIDGTVIDLPARKHASSFAIADLPVGTYVAVFKQDNTSHARRMLITGNKTGEIPVGQAIENERPFHKSSAGTDTLAFSKDGYVTKEAVAETDMTVALSPLTGSGNKADEKLGIYPGYFNEDGHDKFLAFETWLGRTMDFADANLGAKDWSEFGSTSWGLFINPNQSNFKDLTRVTPCLTVPLHAAEVSATSDAAIAQIRQGLQATANGANDDKYNTLADRLIEAGHDNAIIRLGHEPDITYYPWSMRGGNHDVYIQAFRHVHGLLKAKSPNFRIDYQGDGAFNAINPETNKTYAESGYPGDEYVDIIGLDTYDKRPWSEILVRLNYARDFAIARGKPFSVPEWGLWISSDGGNGDNPDYIQNMHDWLNTLPAAGPGSLAYHCYFNGISVSKLDQFPNAKTKFREVFGN